MKTEPSEKGSRPRKGDICQDNTDLRRCSLKSRTENKSLRVFLVTMNELSSTSSFICRIEPGTTSALSSSNFPGASPVQAEQQKEQAHTWLDIRGCGFPSVLFFLSDSSPLLPWKERLFGCQVKLVQQVSAVRPFPRGVWVPLAT